MNRTQAEQDFLDEVDRRQSPRRFSQAICVATLIALAGCGGGDADEEAEVVAKPPKPPVCGAMRERCL